ncbi:hypothetical protein DVH24_001256 [Malus domestica]|uniref:Uncharacterized protein n=1 Tax=Malus domestica TaxID=3750 RepID=A0A498K6P1_MALDO|nr:hypothetical protein DVH24_001256 [Malus domestica]
MLCPDLSYAAMLFGIRIGSRALNRRNSTRQCMRCREAVAEEHKLLERMVEDNEKMGVLKKNLIPDEAFYSESKYYLCVSNPIPSISRIELLILHGSRNTVHSG